jgi:hypothetical protein
MSKVWGSGLTLVLCLPTAVIAQPTKLLSTQYVDCVTNAKGQPVASREVRTPVFTSKKGARAFGVITASSLPLGACENRTTLYVAEPHNSFRLVYRQETEPDNAGSAYDGNGIEAIHWSPSGKRVFFQISQWIWGSDGDGGRKHVVFTSGDHKARSISLIETVWKQFKQECTVRIETPGWIDDDRIKVEAHPFVDTSEEGAPPTLSCIQKPAKFSFNVDTGTYARLR